VGASPTHSLSVINRATRKWPEMDTEQFESSSGEDRQWIFWVTNTKRNVRSQKGMRDFKKGVRGAHVTRRVPVIAIRVCHKQQGISLHESQPFPTDRGSCTSSPCFAEVEPAAGKSIPGKQGTRSAPASPLTVHRRSFASMATNASKLIAQALEAAGVTARGLARRMKISSTSLRKYGYGTRTPTPSVLRQLARLLRRQARELQRLSNALVKSARIEKKALWSERRGGRRKTRRKRSTV